MIKLPTFVLYSNKIQTVKEYERINNEYIKLETPIFNNSLGVYRHSFPCTLTEAVKNFSTLKQILRIDKNAKGSRFYYSLAELSAGTKFNILMFPIVYIYALIDTKHFNKVKLFY